MERRATLLETRTLSKAFGELVLFRDLNLRVLPGQAWRLRGGNGSGKSTFLRVLAGHLSPDQGEVLFEGVSGKTLSPWDREARAPFVDQSPMLELSVAAGENLLGGETVGHGIARWLKGWRRTVRRAVEGQVAETLATLGLSEAMSRPAYELSLGQRRLLTLVRAVHPGLQDRRRVLLLDEPLAGISRQAYGPVIQLLTSALERGWAVLIAEHNDLEEHMEFHGGLEFPVCG